MQLVSGGAKVTALEVSNKRANLLLDNLSRTKLQADVKVANFKTFNIENRFDIVLVDAPCSATGTIRRNCELQYLNPYKRIDLLIKEQISILEKAMLFVKPGGRLLYCTCSLVPSEGEKIIKKIFENNDNWKQIIIDGKTLGVNPEWVDCFGGLRLRPDYWATTGGMDGFYIAILRKDK